MGTGADWRSLAAERAAVERAIRWRHERALARAKHVDDVVAEHATTYWGRPYRRREIGPFESAIELPGAVWSIEGERVVELHTSTPDGVARLLVHDVGLLAPLKRVLRTRHVRIEHAPIDALDRAYG